jgi:hypothetical protein
MFGQGSDRPAITVGTTDPIFIEKPGAAGSVRPGQDYFFVQVRGAQVAFGGSIWERVKRLIIVSQVNLNHPVLGAEGVRAIQRSRQVNWGRAEQLGLATNLIDLVPAVMTHVSISFEFVIDKENRLALLTNLINDDSFMAAVSLAPGVATAAKTVSGLAQKLVQTFIPAEERQPILQFSGDFNIAAQVLRPGYYAIIGTRDERHPLPIPLPALNVQDGILLADGAPITDLSYVVLEVQSTPARTRDLNNGAPWDEKLREAEAEAQDLAGDLQASDEELKQGWERCRNLIRDARSLLRADLNYLRREADAIANDTYKTVSELLSAEAVTHRSRPTALSVRQWRPDSNADREFLGIDPGEDLDESLNEYADQVLASRRVLEAAGFGQLPKRR